MQFPWETVPTSLQQDALAAEFLEDIRRILSRLYLLSELVDIHVGSGSPETVVTANVGSLFLRVNGGASTTLYVKESGTGNTGWVAK